MNNSTFAGRLGKDAEVRRTQDGKTVTSFSLAVDEYRGGEKSTLWVDVSMWGDRFEKLAQYLRKGSSVTVSGRAGVREYNGKAYLTLSGFDVTLQGGKPEGERRDVQDDYREKRPTGGGADLDDEIPF